MSHLAQTARFAYIDTAVVRPVETLLSRLLRGAWMDILALKDAADVTWLRAL